MNRIELIQMIEESGLRADAYDAKAVLFWYPELEVLASLIEKHVAEECAKACDWEAVCMGSNGKKDASALNCADAIRSLYKPTA